ncbi:hypothetical protein [Sutterella wadsworthensis]|jgi:hypothetical protein|uniref:hypothetical protein n=1 Tax=Sutterella wadsworthensis TaxID=40545 RepID=UPI00242C9E01|nr:hypothetical protein [Sutterella wadsworthensis]
MNAQSDLLLLPCGQLPHKAMQRKPDHQRNREAARQPNRNALQSSKCPKKLLQGVQFEDNAL